MKADTICCYSISMQVHNKRGIAGSLHAYINKARLTKCEVGVFLREISYALFEKPLKFIAHGCIFKRLRYYQLLKLNSTCLWFLTCTSSTAVAKSHLYQRSNCLDKHSLACLVWSLVSVLMPQQLLNVPPTFINWVLERHLSCFGVAQHAYVSQC